MPAYLERNVKEVSSIGRSSSFQPLLKLLSKRRLQVQQTQEAYSSLRTCFGVVQNIVIFGFPDGKNGPSQDYEATHTDYSESIDALTRAIVAVMPAFSSTSSVGRFELSFSRRSFRSTLHTISCSPPPALRAYWARRAGGHPPSAIALTQLTVSGGCDSIRF